MANLELAPRIEHTNAVRHLHAPSWLQYLTRFGIFLLVGGAVLYFGSSMVSSMTRKIKDNIKDTFSL